MPRRSRDDDDEFEEDRPAKKSKRSRRREIPNPVRGKVVGTSKLKLVGLMLFGLFFLVLCGFLLFDGLVIGDAKTFLPFRMTWWGYLLAVAGFLVGVFCPVAALIGFLRPTQLVFGKRVFQEQRKSGGEWVVILQIPYDNIRKVKYETQENDTHVGIRFYDIDDDDTFIEDDTAHEVAQGKGWDFILNGLFTMSLKEIASELDDRARDAADD